MAGRQRRERLGRVTPGVFTQDNNIHVKVCVCMHVSVFFGLYSHHSLSLFLVLFSSLYVAHNIYIKKMCVLLH